MNSNDFKEVSLLKKWTILKETSLLQGIHLMGEQLFRTLGYRWELRHSGEAKLGYFKKVLRAKDHKKAYPTRFVLVPGFGDSPLSWALVLFFLQPILKQNFDEVILFDFPGYGGFLSRDKAFPSLDMMILSLNDALDSLKPHTILGHSLGGWLSANYAALCGGGSRPTANPRNYSGPDTILLVNSSGIFPNEKLKRRLTEIFLSVVDGGFAPLRPHLFFKEPSWFKLVARQFMSFLSREDIIEFMKTVKEEHTIADIAHQIKSKVWLIWGEEDTLVPISCAPAWLEHLNPALHHQHHVIFLHRAGHSPHIEQPAVVAAVLAQILSGSVPHSRGKRWWRIMHEAR